MPNGDAVSGTGSPSQSPGGSNTSRPVRPARPPPPPQPRRPAASPCRKKQHETSVKDLIAFAQI